MKSKQIFQILSLISIFHWRESNCKRMIDVGSLKIKSIEMRSARNDDIGLYFDLTIENVISNKWPKETLSYAINSDKCCIEMATEEVNCEISKIFGGQFEQLEPGKTALVTLIWPTLTLYNRIGFCTINLTANPNNGNKINIERTIHFNTTVAPGFHNEAMSEYKNSDNVSECKTKDLNPFDFCRPVNCVEKYFGHLNYFNWSSGFCETVTNCGFESDVIYNFQNNECVDLNEVLTADDLMRLESGEFDKNIWRTNEDLNPAKLGSSQTNLDHIVENVNKHDTSSNNETNLMMYILIMLLTCVIAYITFSSLCIGLLLLIWKKQDCNKKLDIKCKKRCNYDVDEYDERSPFVIE